jgi:tRNA pseudouridine55 synthase
LPAQRRNKGRNINGIVLLDKPTGLSSNAALQRVKRLFEANKAGHTGSLDPLATGVLPLCLGEATKVSQFLLDSDKKYRATVKLGVRTDSADSEGNVIATCDDFKVTREEVLIALEHFKGEIQQIPPMHSALKVDGIPLYKRARKGEVIERKPRTIVVYSIELTKFSETELVLEISSSKGTYIRTIADDLGELLGCGGHITALHRMKAGVFSEEACYSLEFLTERKEASGLSSLDDLLIPMDKAIEDLPAVVLPSITADFVKNGQAVLVSHLPAEGLVRMYEEERFLGIGCIDDDGRVAPKRLVVTHD